VREEERVREEEKEGEREGGREEMAGPDRAQPTPLVNPTQ
jgi:hypothetical protein